MNLSPRHAAILTVGTEIASGQIVNGNAAWISRRLSDAGAEVVLHETVPDDRPMIRAALERCASVARLLVVTGGLGPTSDDFTREVIAQWAARKLEFHEPSWTKIEKRLGRLGIPIAPSNRQQCFFPTGSEVLPNPEGTADGFFLQQGDVLAIWVLPGPPREIEAIWDRERAIDPTLRALLPAELSRLRLYTWDCLGKSESELGELVESVLQGSGLQTGYRVHRPYVEVKIWAREDSLEAARPWFARLEAAIEPWLMGRQGEDIGARWLEKLRSFEEIEIADACTGGLLADRIGALLRMPGNRELASAIALVTEWNMPASPEDWVRAALEQAQDGILTLAIAGLTSDGIWTLGFREGNRIHLETLPSPWRNVDLLERARSFTVETALKKWGDWLGLEH